MVDLTTPEEIEKAVELLETSMICALDKSCQSVKRTGFLYLKKLLSWSEKKEKLES